VQALLLAIMLASLLMSSAIGEAFADRAWLFVIPYVATQVGRAAFATVTFLPGSNQRIHFVNVLAWELGTGVLWVAGALADGDTRLALWAGAVVLTHLGVWFFHPVPGRPSHLAAPIGPDAHGVHSDVSGEHLLERLRLFFLIALGETLLTTGSAFATEEVALGPVIAFANAFAASVALYFCYFQRAEREGLRATESSEDASGVMALGTHVLTLIVLALIAIAVGDELAIAHPGADPWAGYLALVFGGPALFLAGQLYFMRRVGARGLRPRVLAVLALALLALAMSRTSLLAASIAATLVLVAVAASDRRPTAPLVDVFAVAPDMQ
jgi:low temperature requirement protein LtrA